MSDPRPTTSRRAVLKFAAGVAVPGLPLAAALAKLPTPTAATGMATLATAIDPATGVPGNWASVTDATVWAKAWAARFTNVLPNPNAAAFIYAADAGTGVKGVTPRYTIKIGQTAQDILGIKDAKGKAVLTPCWGYGNWETAAVTYPGRSFKVTRNQAVDVVWVNNLSAADGSPLPHLLPVDPTLMMAQVHNTGVPVAIHHHGGDNAFEFDGGPEQWMTPQRVEVGPGLLTAADIAAGGKPDTPLTRNGFPLPAGTQPNEVKASATGIYFKYLNAQEASLHWYHDHAEGITRQNVNTGLAGLYFVTDTNEALLRALNVIPSAGYETTLVLQDRIFDAAGNLSFPANPLQSPDYGTATAPSNQPSTMPENFGDIIVVNGKAWPVMDVEPRPYRVRLLGGADSRFFQLSLVNAKGGSAKPEWYIIGTDLGFLNRGVDTTNAAVTVAPGERWDTVIDFSGLAGKTFTLTNGAPAPFPGGDPVTKGTSQVMQFRVSQARNWSKPAPIASLLTVLPLRVTGDTPLLVKSSNLDTDSINATRRILLGEGTDAYLRTTPMLGVYDPTDLSGKAGRNLGSMSFYDPPTEQPVVGTSEIWEFWNVTDDAHPIHMHLTQFRILDRRPFKPVEADAKVMSNGSTGVRLTVKPTMTGPRVTAPAHEQGWKDTVICPPAQVTRVLVNFKREGSYVYHCHMLAHEEHSMMRWFRVKPA